MRALTIAALCLTSLNSGCTVEDGRGFAYLSGKLYSVFLGTQPGNSRLLPDGWFKTADSFELKLEKLTIEVRSLRLQAQASSAAVASGTCTFDPSSPPAGCSLCHGGHCHCDGKLVSYEELKAKACGATTGGATLSTLEQLLVANDQELLGPGTRNEDLACSGSCELKQGSATQVSLLLDALKMTAQVRDRSVADRLSGKTMKVQLDWDLAGAALSHAFDAALVMDRDNPYMLDLTVKLPVTDKLLDGMEWHKLTAAGDNITIDVSNNKSAGQTIATSLADTKLEVVVTRDDG